MECHNCGVPVYEAPGHEGSHSIQMEYATDSGVWCEACFFDSYDEAGVAIVARELAASLTPEELGSDLASEVTRDWLRHQCSIFGVSRERSMTKSETATRFARKKPEIAAKALVKRGRLA